MKTFAIIVGLISLICFIGICWAFIIMTIAEQHEFNELEEMDDDHAL